MRSWVAYYRTGILVSMKSGLEGRNNANNLSILPGCRIVSMKSGLEGRNNIWTRLRFHSEFMSQ